MLRQSKPAPRPATWTLVLRQSSFAKMRAFQSLREPHKPQEISKARVVAQAIPVLIYFQIYNVMVSFLKGLFQPCEGLFLIPQPGINRCDVITRDILRLRTPGQLLKDLACFRMVSRSGVEVSEVSCITWKTSAHRDRLIRLRDCVVVPPLLSIRAGDLSM